MPGDGDVSGGGGRVGGGVVGGGVVDGGVVDGGGAKQQTRVWPDLLDCTTYRAAGFLQILNYLKWRTWPYVWFYHRVSQGYHFTIAIWHMEGR